jgi:hypothetical protein
VLALVIPAVPFKVKEFAYAGFAITLVSAAIAHFGRGDARNLSVLYVVDPLVFSCSVKWRSSCDRDRRCEDCGSGRNQQRRASCGSS